MSGRTTSAGRSGESLRERRQRSRFRILVVSSVLFCVLLGALIYGVWQPGVRIGNVVMYGTDQSLAQVARVGLEGSYFGVIPHDSTFFLYESGIRSALLSKYPDIAAVSIFRKGLTSLSVRTDPRTSVAHWCGTILESTSTVSRANCYVFDSSGFIFAPTATSTETINPISVYAPLQSGVGEPLRATIANADKLSASFDFARQLGTLGSPVSIIVFHEGEVDQYLLSGTRISYVLGNEQNAYTALHSARTSLNLSDGSLLYVDLRFDGKVYLKRK